MLYWLHRLFHGGGFWKYHAIHHSSEELDWISAARFHPVNLFLGTIAVDVDPADGRHFAQHHALGRAVHDLPFGLRSRQSQLDAWPVQICAGDAGVPSLAPHRRWKRAATPTSPGPFRSGISCSEPSGCRKTGCPRTTASTIRRIPSEIVGQLAYPFRQIRSCRVLSEHVSSGSAFGHARIAGGPISVPFAVRSHIDVRFALSGAGSAAYRFCRLVNAPG